MTLSHTVPPNTMIADLDESLRLLLTRELASLGFDSIDVAFEAPTRDWSAKLTRPTVNVFLADLRRSQRPSRQGSSASAGGSGRVAEGIEPLRMDLMYAITAWAPSVIDEHRLLSQVLSVLYTYPKLDGELVPRLRDGSQAYGVTATVAGERAEQRSGFWRSVGGDYKPALDYVVTLAVESGLRVERGPAVRTTSVRTSLQDVPRGSTLELHNVGGTVRDADGEPVRDAWIAAPGLARLALTDADGRFRMVRVPAGTHEVRARGPEGGDASVEAVIPGPPVDLTLGRTDVPERLPS
jgi:hypothetical protein